MEAETFHKLDFVQKLLPESGTHINYMLVIKLEFVHAMFK
jgi:hypothetical protein